MPPRHELPLCAEPVRVQARASEEDGGRQVKCRRCQTNMRPGLALAQSFTGIGDFHDDDDVVTLSPGGSGHLVSVMKCPACGYSVDYFKEGRADDA